MSAIDSSISQPSRTYRRGDDAALEAEILVRGEAIWHSMQDAVPGLFDQELWQARLLDWAMRDPDFKTDLFRFVDVLPMLETSEQVAEHVRGYLLREDRDLPRLIRAVIRATERSLTSGAASFLIRQNTAHLARNFIAGNDGAEAVPVLKKLHGEGLAFSVDLLGEATISDADAAEYQRRYLELIDLLAAEVSLWPGDDIVDTNHLGPIPRANISLKISSLEGHLDPVDSAGSVARVAARVLPILLRARERGVAVNIDLENWELHGITFDLLEELLAHPELKDWPDAGMVVQAYLKRAHRDVDRLLSLARSRGGTPITVRLVKGAYWDYEVMRARRHGFECPVFTNKAETDAQYEELSRLLLSHTDHLLPAFASHNLRSVTHALVAAQDIGVPAKAYEIQMLYGMAEPERQALRQAGHRVRVYAPVGELLSGIAYLIRRLLENTSNEGFLRLGFHEGAKVEELLARPRTGSGMTSGSAEPRGTMVPGDLDTPFENCAPADFTDPSARASFGRAVAAAAESLPRQVPVVVAGKCRPGERVMDRVCPSDTERLVAKVAMATRQDVDDAVDSAEAAWPEWRDRPLRERAQMLETLAARLETDRYDLAALQVFEEAKPWREADADVAEAIDFCRYYARQSLCELQTRLQDVRPGESNLLMYQGRGTVAVIAPWNFPMAILCGMTAAALVAGNTVLIKPAEQSSAVGHALYECLLASGFPAEVVHFLPGRGEEVGARLVEHPAVAQIAFTGSREVGLGIVERAARTAPGQRQVKRVVCEMGGKNAIIVDDDADLDEAVSGVIQSAFGYAGQKCSACSRCIIVGPKVYEAFAARLVEASRDLIRGPAHAPECRLGPVIDGEAHQRLLGVIEDPGEGAELLYAAEDLAGGYYVGPAVFAVRDAGHRLMQEELFGPILTVMEAGSFEAALEMAGNSEFALTGGLYSRHPGHVELARQRFRVGNLYINGPCTGALVHRQPFGGFGMSGLGTKAGGPGYLLQFADPRCVAENTVRHGFAPDVYA